MAEANICITQNQFTCSVCLCLLKDPATISCGHSYCMCCINGCWDQEEEKGTYSCPQCRQTFNPRPVVGRNLILAEMVEKLRTAGVEESPCESPCEPEEPGPGEVQCTVCVGRKRKADKSCLECLASYCETHFNRHEELHSGKRHKVVEAVLHPEVEICSTHNKPLEVWCRTDQLCVCPLCIIDEHKGHDIITAAAAKTEKQEQLGKSFKEEIAQRENELVLLQQALEPYKCSAKKALDASERIFTELISLVEEGRSEVKELIIAQEEAQLTEVDQLQRELDQRITLLKRSNAELDQLVQTEDCIHFLQSLPSLSLPQDLHGVTISSHTYFENTETSLSNLREHVADLLDKDFKDITTCVKQTLVENMSREHLRKYFCQPTLDVYTAFRHHKISMEGTKIEWSHDVISRYNSTERFFRCRQVLCNTGLSGRHYWEVDWKVEDSSSKSIEIAVAYSTMNRNGDGVESVFGGNDQSWSLECSKSSFTYSHNNLSIAIGSQSYSKIGVYLDHKAGILAFYGVSYPDITLLHRVKTTFTKPLYPGFYIDSFTELQICKKM
ncbi:tripartite motif-containing protein 16-like isoform 1-T3 [Polymixia lowei]